MTLKVLMIVLAVDELQTFSQKIDLFRDESFSCCLLIFITASQFSVEENRNVLDNLFAINIIAEEDVKFHRKSFVRSLINHYEGSFAFTRKSLLIVIAIRVATRVPN